MPYLVDTDVLVDVSRTNVAAIAHVDGLHGDWALSTITALELISGARNQREVSQIDRLIEAYETIAVNDAIGRRAYELLKVYARSNGLRTFDSLIAAAALEQRRTLVTRNRKHFQMIAGLAIAVPAYSLDSTSADKLVPIMAKSANTAGQYWKFMVSGGCYRLSNVLLGPDRSLDNYPEGNHLPFMGPTGDYSGQCWHLSPEHDGYLRLTNDYLGNSHSLDTYSDREHLPFMAETSTATGQYWKLTRLTRQ